MSKYYNPKRIKNIFDPKSQEPFRLSRSKIDLYINCPRCFYLDRRLGVGQPPGYPFSLNSAVDTLLKKEFDTHRAKGQPHPLMKHYKIEAIPLQHAKMNEWRDALRGGVQFYHQPSNFLVTGAPDDVWVSPGGELIVVDYKATAKEGEVNLEANWQDGYKRQMEVYQWLFRQNNFLVSSTGYFVYVNGQTDRAAFDGRLEFDIKLIPYRGDDSWVEPTLLEIKKVLTSPKIPPAHPDCDFCRYRKAASALE